MISKNHANRSMHNWLAYNIGDKFLIKHLVTLKGVVYDLGCGESPYREFILKYADRYIGVDWTSTIHQSQANIVANLNEPLEIEANVADSVISLSVLEHLCEPQIMLNEACRILKKDGQLILQVPWQWRIHEAPYDFFRYTPYALEYMLKKAGFSHILIEPQSGFFTMAILKFNYFLKRFVRGPKLVRTIIGFIFIPIWYLGQTLAPLLDKLDGNWSLETTGYFVTARKV